MRQLLRSLPFASDSVFGVLGSSGAFSSWVEVVDDGCTADRGIVMVCSTTLGSGSFSKVSVCGNKFAEEDDA